MLFHTRQFDIKMIRYEKNNNRIQLFLYSIVDVIMFVFSLLRKIRLFVPSRTGPHYLWYIMSNISSYSHVTNCI